MSKEFEQAYKDYCEGKVKDPTKLLRVMWEENKEAIDSFIAKGGFYTKTQRTWVGLTLDERLELAQDVDWAAGAYCEYAEKIEAKLKEKNT